MLEGSEEHESVFPHQPDALEEAHGAEVLLDGDALMERLQALLGPRLQPHIHEVQTRVSHTHEEVGIDGVGPAVDLPDDLPRQSGTVQFFDKVACPPPPHRAE